MNDRIRRAAQHIITDLIVKDELDKVEEAIGWIVVSRDLEAPTERLSEVFGPFPDAMSATVWADKHAQELNFLAGPDDGGWDIYIVPILTAH